MNQDYVWIDRKRNKYTLDDISDRYLLNILGFLDRGGGWSNYITDYDIKLLFEEADKRKIKHKFSKDKAIQFMKDKYLSEHEFDYPDWDW